MTILKTVELADFAEKNAKRIRNTHSENGKVGRLSRVGMPKEWEWNAEEMRIRMLYSSSTERTEIIAMQCTFCYANPKRKDLRGVIVFPIFLRTFIHETMLSATVKKFASF